MASQILVLDGDTDTVNLFQEEFLKLGMISIELDTVESWPQDITTDVVAPLYTFVPADIFPFIVTLLGTGGLVEIIKSILNAHKGEGTIELDEQGRITKVTFKNMMPNDVGKVVNSISEATKREAVTN